MTSLHWGASGWLWALGLLPLLGILYAYNDASRKKQMASFIDARFWSVLIPGWNPDGRWRQVLVSLLVLGLLFLTLARPQMGGHLETVQMSGLDLMVVLDLSHSMEVTDVVPSRLKKSKHLIRKLLDRLHGDRVGVVGFAESAYVACPLTNDLDYVWNSVDILTPQFIEDQGTNISGALAMAVEALDRGAQSSGGERLILLISDGEDHEPGAVDQAKKIKSKGMKLYVLGVGTESGGPIPLLDSQGTVVGFKKDRSRQSIISKFHPAALNQIAQAASGAYWSVTASEEQVQNVQKSLESLARSDYGEKKTWVYEEKFQIPLGILVAFLLGSLFFGNAVLFLGIAFLATSPAEASFWDDYQAYQQNKKAMDSYEKGNWEEAEKFFGSAQARNPDSAELDFNQGVIRLKKDPAEDFDQGILALERSLEASKKQKKESLLGRIFYNLGNAWAKKGDVKKAVKAYLEAISSAQKQKDAGLEYAARKNLELLLKQIQQKKQQNQKDQQEKKDHEGKQEKKDQKDKQGKPEKKDQKDEQGKSEKKNQKDEQGKQEKKGSAAEDIESKDDSEEKGEKSQFQSQKMSEEDAKRVMSELNDREKELQKKLQYQPGKKKKHEKDW